MSRKDITQRPRSHVDCALLYASRGLAVFPLRPRDKRPATQRGFKDATLDVGTILAWWQRSPMSNIGVATSGEFFVIDIDVDPSKEEDGLSTLAEWEEAYGELPQTMRVTTGRGGVHIYYHGDRDIRCSTNTKLGVDIRGRGGYVVGMGSIHPNGKAYAVCPGYEGVGITEADENVYAFVDYIQNRDRKRPPQGSQTAYALPTVIDEGSRHDTLVRYAASLRARGASDDEIETLLGAVNAQRCQPMCPQTELDSIVRWACALEAGPARSHVTRTLASASAAAKDTARQDDEVIALAKTDVEFVRLWESSAATHKSVDAARKDLMARLAFWTCRDTEQIERIYKRSRLYADTQSTDLVRAMAIEASRHAKMVYDEELGAVPVSVTQGKFLRPSSPIWDHRGNVRYNRLADVIRSDLFARTIDGAVAYWDGRWVFGRRAIEQATFLFTDELSQKGRSEVAAHVLDNARKTPATDSGRDYDNDVYVQFTNGTYRVSPNEVTQVTPNPRMLVVGTLPVEYREVAPNAADAFLDDISCGDDAVRQALEEVIGACMSAAHVVSKSIVLQGRAGAGGSKDASNGKSTFVKLLQALLGSQNVTCLSPEAMGSRFQCATIIGKLAVLADDINPDALANRRNSAFKQIVSGNTIHTDIKGKDGCDFKPLATSVLSLNGVLNLREMDGGLRRRLLFIPFRAHFEEGHRGCNMDIASDLAHDEAAMQRLAFLGIQGLQRLVRNRRFTHIEGSEEEIDGMFRETDAVGAWVHDEAIDYLRDVDGQTTSSVYARFKDWCEQRGWEHIPNEQVFSRKLSRDAEFVSTVRRSIEDGALVAPKNWKIGTRPHWEPLFKKTIRRYGLQSA